VRAEAGIKIRQPLAKIFITKKSLPDEFFALIKDEVNVKELEVVEKLPTGKELKINADENYKVCLDIKLSAELKCEGYVRELIRFINALRKDLDLTISDTIEVYYETKEKDLLKTIKESADELSKSTLAKSFINEKIKLDKDSQKELDVNGLKIWVGIKKP
jgi:isoleucyl-tRNA synthetase